MSTLKAIQEKLERTLQVEHLEVLNESHKHRTAPGAETHIRVVLVSPHFSGQPNLARHREVNQILAHELANGVHALALQLYTPEQWQQRQAPPPESPPCAHKH